MDDPEVNDIPTAEQASALLDAALDGGVAEPVAEPVAEVDVTPEVATPQAVAETPAYVPPAVPDAVTARLAEIDATLAALGEQLADGTVEIEDYTAQTRAMEREAGRLVARIEFAESRAQEDRSSAEQRFWADEQNRPFADHPGLFQALNQTVIALRNNPETMARGQDWVLAEARRSVIDPIAALIGKPVSVAPSGDIRAQARAKVDATPSASPASLSDIPGGTAAAVSEYEAVNGKDAVGMLDSVSEWSKDRLDSWLDRRI